jgi:hypothetical protein
MKSKSYEGSPKDIREDKAGAKKAGMSMKAYENTAKDRAQDKAGQRRMTARRR